MKAISLWQPWASLIRMQVKTVETRSWKTDYRGDLLICAAQKKNKMIKEYYYQNIRPRLYDVFPISATAKYIDSSYRFYEYDDFPIGQALAIANLVDCQKITLELITRYSAHKKYVPDYKYEDARIISRRLGNEIAFGDWTPGRYAWIFSGITPLNFPFDVKGKQGLFDVDHDNIDYVAYSWFDTDSEETVSGVDLFDNILRVKKEGLLDQTFQEDYRGSFQDCDAYLNNRLQ